MGLFRRKGRRAGSRSVTREIGVLFDIDGLGGGFYGRAAYQILLAALDPHRLTNCTFHDGDTHATLYGTRREYCIAVRGDAQQVDYVRQVMAKRTDEGLYPPDRRFLDGNVTGREPLVRAGSVSAEGTLVVAENEMIQPDWAEVGAWRVVTR